MVKESAEMAREPNLSSAIQARQELCSTCRGKSLCYYFDEEKCSWKCPSCYARTVEVDIQAKNKRRYSALPPSQRRNGAALMYRRKVTPIEVEEIFEGDDTEADNTRVNTDMGMKFREKSEGGLSKIRKVTREYYEEDSSMEDCSDPMANLDIDENDANMTNLPENLSSCIANSNRSELTHDGKRRAQSSFGRPRLDRKCEICGRACKTVRASGEGAK